MAWEVFIGSYFARKALDAIIETGVPRAKSFYSERAGRWVNRTLAEKFLRLEGAPLLGFYKQERPIEVTVAGHAYILPAVMLHQPTGSSPDSARSLGFKIDGAQFEPEEILEPYTSPVRAAAEADRKVFNGLVARLDSVSDGIATLRPVRYFDALATNFAMDHRPRGRSESLREFVQQDGSVGPLIGSPLANHLGVVAMIETADGMLVAQRRTARVANRPRSISASVSGAVNWTDVRGWRGEPPESSIEHLATALFRETLEELGVELRSTVYLGIMREFLRGGKPEMYYFCRSTHSYPSLLAAGRTAEGRSEVEGLEGYEFHSERVKADDTTRYQFQERVKKVLMTTEADANFTFVAGTLLAAAHVMGPVTR